MTQRPPTASCRSVRDRGGACQGWPGCGSASDHTSVSPGLWVASLVCQPVKPGHLAVIDRFIATSAAPAPCSVRRTRRPASPGAGHVRLAYYRGLACTWDAASLANPRRAACVGAAVSTSPSACWSDGPRAPSAAKGRRPFSGVCCRALKPNGLCGRLGPAELPHPPRLDQVLDRSRHFFDHWSRGRSCVRSTSAGVSSAKQCG